MVRPALADGDFGAEFVADADIGERADLVNREAGDSGTRVFNRSDCLAGVRVEERPAIAHLAAGFGVERRLIENDFGFGRRPDSLSTSCLIRSADPTTFDTASSWS